MKLKNFRAEAKVHDNLKGAVRQSLSASWNVQPKYFKFVVIICVNLLHP